MQNIKFILVIVAVIIAGIFLGNVYMSAKSPSSVKVTVYKVEILADASDTNPQVIFSNPEGQEIDFTKEVDAVTGQGQIRAGQYKRIRMTVNNGIKLSIAKESDNPCGGEIFADREFHILEGTNPDSQVQINFATYDDKGGTWSGPQIVHLLLRPVSVSENKNAEIKFRFNTADTLFCSDNAVQRRAPWSLWAGTLSNATN